MLGVSLEDIILLTSFIVKTALAVVVTGFGGYLFWNAVKLMNRGVGQQVQKMVFEFGNVKANASGSSVLMLASGLLCFPSAVVMAPSVQKTINDESGQSEFGILANLDLDEYQSAFTTYAANNDLSTASEIYTQAYLSYLNDCSSSGLQSAEYERCQTEIAEFLTIGIAQSKDDPDAWLRSILPASESVETVSEEE